MTSFAPLSGPLPFPPLELAEVPESILPALSALEQCRNGDAVQEVLQELRGMSSLDMEASAFDLDREIGSLTSPSEQNANICLARNRANSNFIIPHLCAFLSIAEDNFPSMQDRVTAKEYAIYTLADFAGQLAAEPQGRKT
ncbi:MAG: hypothetical protein K1X79_13420 [Oligoflexia bacterium]|nr:hypothetical protein [Oligoflexia bacterium]